MKQRPARGASLTARCSTLLFRVRLGRRESCHRLSAKTKGGVAAAHYLDIADHTIGSVSEEDGPVHDGVAPQPPPARPQSGHGGDRGQERRRSHTLLGKFLATLAIGLAIEFVLQFAHHAGYLDRFEDFGADWVMALHRNVAVAPGKAVPFVYVDVDERTYRDWGEPLLLPRARLAKLIDRTLEGGPRLLIVDVDFTRSDGTDDRALEEVLARHGQAGAATPILLARALGPVSAEASECNPLHEHGDGHPAQLTSATTEPGPNGCYPRLRRSFLDPVLARSPNLHWASVWLRTTPDAVARRWSLWQPTCADKGGRPVVLPSMPLATYALINDGSAGFGALERQLAGLAPGDCAHPPSAERESIKLRIGERIIVLGEEGRVLFDIPWRLPEGEARPLVETTAGRRTPLLTVISADALLDAYEGPGPGGVLDGAVAVIGGSYSEGFDVHATPIGRMPGALILINAAHTALQFPQAALYPPPLWQEWLLAGLLIAAVALFFTLLPLGAAMGLSLLLTLAVTLGANFSWLRAGVWVDVTLPVLGIVVHRWVGSIEHSWAHYGPHLGRLRFWERHHD